MTAAEFLRIVLIGALVQLGGCMAGSSGGFIERDAAGGEGDAGNGDDGAPSSDGGKGEQASDGDVENNPPEPIPIRTFYVSPTGQDDRDARSAEQAWRTLAKVNGFALQAGDHVLLERGGVWREELIVPASGTETDPILFGAYGSGENPIIKRTDVFDDWQLHYDAQGIKIWRGFIESANGRPRGVVADGQRRSTLYLGQYLPPQSLLVENHLFAPEGSPGKRDFYYRNDEGVPQNTEVGTRQFGILIDAKKNIIIERIDCEGPGAHSSSTAPSAPIYIDPYILADTTLRSRNILVRDLETRQSNGSGIHNGDVQDNTDTAPRWVPVGPIDVTYLRIVAHDNQDTGIYHRGSGAILDCISHNNGLLPYDNGDRGGIGIQGGPLEVRGNEIFNIGRPDTTIDFGISAWQATGPLNIHGNYIHDVTCGGIQISYEEDTTGEGHMIHYNIIARYGSGVSEEVSSGKTAAIRINRANGMRITNNVIAFGAGAQTTSSFFARYFGKNVSLENNIFYLNTGPDIVVYYDTPMDGFVADHNIFYRKTYNDAWRWQAGPINDFSSWQNTPASPGENSLTDDPLFALNGNTAAEEFRLCPGSPAFDSGSVQMSSKDFAGTTVPINARRDRGALEFQARACK